VHICSRDCIVLGLLIYTGQSVTFLAILFLLALVFYVYKKQTHTI